MNLNSSNNKSYLGLMPSPSTVTAVAMDKPPPLAMPPQIVDSTIVTITSDEQQQQQQSALKYSASIKSSPQSPSSPQRPLLHVQPSTSMPSTAAAAAASASSSSSSSISSATTLSSGGYHSNLISRISNIDSCSSIKDKVQISCNLSQDMEATGSKNNNNLSNKTSVNLNLTLNNSNNNLNLIDNNMTTHGSASGIITDATSASILQMPSFGKTSLLPLVDVELGASKVSAASPLHFLKLPLVEYAAAAAAVEVQHNAMMSCLHAEDALNLSSIEKGGMTTTATSASSSTTTTQQPLNSSGIVQSGMVTAASASLRHDDSGDLMRRPNCARN